MRVSWCCSPFYLESALPLQQLSVEQFSVPHGSTQLALQTIGPLRTKYRVQQVPPHLQQTETLLQLDTVLQQTLTQRTDRKNA